MTGQEPGEPRFVALPASYVYGAVIIGSRPIEKLPMVFMQIASGFDSPPAETLRLALPEAAGSRLWFPKRQRR